MSPITPACSTPAPARSRALIGELQAKTGAEIAVVIVDSTQPLSAFDYAMEIAEAWKPGSKSRDNGVVFLAAINDRQMFILDRLRRRRDLCPTARSARSATSWCGRRSAAATTPAACAPATTAMATIIAQRQRRAAVGGAPGPAGAARRPAGSALLPILLLIIFVIVAFRFPLLPLFMGGRAAAAGGGFGGFGGGGFGGGGGGFGGFGGGGFGGGGGGWGLVKRQW